MRQKGWSILFGVVLTACLGLFAVAPLVGWWLPPLVNPNSYGREVDRLFYLILGFTGFFFLLTEVALVWAMWKYAAKPGGQSASFHGNHKLELVWTLIPAGILVFLAFAQISAWADIKYASRMQAPQQVIEVSARQFEWRIRYPDASLREKLTAAEGSQDWNKASADAWGNDPLAASSDFHVVNEIHTWKGANTRIYLKSRDVLHSFFLPHLRLKQDAVPGKTIPIWFRAEETNGEWVNGAWRNDKDEQGRDKIWELACAELCGWGHYKMQGRLYVHKDRASYDRWLTANLAQQRATSEAAR